MYFVLHGCVLSCVKTKVVCEVAAKIEQYDLSLSSVFIIFKVYRILFTLGYETDKRPYNSVRFYLCNR